MSRPDICAQVEAVLIVAGEPLTAADLAEGLGVEESDMLEVLDELRRDYDGDGAGEGIAAVQRGFELRQSASGWRLHSRADQYEAVKGFLTRGQSAKLSQAALETLAVVAYAQPITRARISAIRGVNVDGVVRTLLMRGLIVEHDGDEGPAQFVTSHVFLEALGLDSLEQLPDIAPYLPGSDEIPAEG